MIVAHFWMVQTLKSFEKIRLRSLVLSMAAVVLLVDLYGRHGPH